MSVTQPACLSKISDLIPSLVCLFVFNVYSSLLPSTNFSITRIILSMDLVSLPSSRPLYISRSPYPQPLEATNPLPHTHLMGEPGNESRLRIPSNFVSRSTPGKPTATSDPSLFSNSFFRVFTLLSIYF